LAKTKNEDAWRNFVEQNQIRWSERFDAGGEMLRQFEGRAFPTFVLTDDRGTVFERFVGADRMAP
jgi:hypothetical protein